MNTPLLSFLSSLSFFFLSFFLGVHNPDGLDIEALHKHFVLNKTLKGFAAAEFFEDGSDVLGVECDVLIPAALEKTIHVANAHTIKAKVIIILFNIYICTFFF